MPRKTPAPKKIQPTSGFSLKREAEHPHPHDHEHPHDHDHPHGHDHPHADGLWPTIASALHLPGYAHTHDRPGQSDALFTNALGIRTLYWALALLGLTTLLQIAIYLASGSVALLADTVHNLGDALNSIPLLLAFYLGRRAANARYTYGYGRAEDIAGVFIVISIAFSAGYILWEAFQKLLNPLPIANGGWVVLAAVIGFLGNEAVAILQISVGRRIGSEAMITDGRHARIDGLTSLAVLPAVVGSAMGFPIIDPIFGLVIGVSILFITRDAIRAIWYRLMDAVDPSLTDLVRQRIEVFPEVQSVRALRLRWVGHTLWIEGELSILPDQTVSGLNALLETIKHDLSHAVPNLGQVTLAVASGLHV
ncbi:MAG: cation transporter [Anaerolineae bacterium]|nr:MAG: cation transporter [Anaerolineae bacterium]